MVPDKAFPRKFPEFLQFSLEPPDNIFIDSGFRGKQADHDQFLGALANSPAKKAGVTLVKNIDNPVVINILSAFTNYGAAGGTGGDFLRHRLIAFWAKFHGLKFTTKTGPMEELRALVRIL